MKNRSDRALLLFLAAGLLLCSMLAFLFPAPRLSERENRLLAPAPKLSLSALLDGTWESGLDLYLTERFPLRTPLRSLHAVAELGIGKLEVSRVMLARDGSLIKRHTPDAQLLTGNLRSLAALTRVADDAGVPCTLAILPRSMDVRRDVLPAPFTAEQTSWEALAEALPSATVLWELTEDTDWYRTDHHWTTHGAYRGYLSLCPLLGITPLGEESFRVECVSSNFYGTTDAAAGIPGIAADEIHLYHFEGEEELSVRRNGEKVPFSSLYDLSKLAERDQYAVFLGGNAATVEITQRTKGVAPRPRLLVYRDSYASALLPFLARHFDILAVDPRYDREPPSSYLSGASAVLILFGMQTLGEARLMQRI